MLLLFVNIWAREKKRMFQLTYACGIHELDFSAELVHSYMAMLCMSDHAMYALEQVAAQLACVHVKFSRDASSLVSKFELIHTYYHFVR